MVGGVGVDIIKTSRYTVCIYKIVKLSKNKNIFKKKVTGSQFSEYFDEADRCVYGWGSK